jgi:hypothetical protein
LLIAPVGTLGVVLLMQTNVFEKANQTRFADSERPYSRVLGQLRDALKASASG